MLKWLRAFAQTTTYLGVAAIAVVCGSVAFLTHEEHARATEDGLRQGSNLVRIFDAYIARVVGGADSVLLTLRDQYERDRKNFDITQPLSLSPADNAVVLQFGLIGPDGSIRLSSAAPVSPGQTVKNRDYYQSQANASTDELFISAPAVGRISGHLLIQLVRRMTAPDGSFDGLIVASIDVDRLQEFYNSIDIGRQGIISLTGLDGIVRARSGRNPAARSLIGRKADNTFLHTLVHQSPAGSYWNFESPQPRLDEIRRLISYRVVEGYPLIAVVGLAEGDIFEQADLTARRYYVIGSMLIACVIGAMWIGARRQRKLSQTVQALERSKRSLERTNFWFDTALENMPHGLCMFDQDHRLIVCNERYGEMYRLTPEQTAGGATLRSILASRMANGAAPKGSQGLAERLQGILTRAPGDVEHELYDGRTVAISHQSMPDGGWVAVHQDITERKHAETQIAYMARHDGLTGLVNRTVLLERIEQELERVRAGGGAFAVFMLDLDLFKTINDSLGHPVGDGLLKIVAARLSACVSEADTVARLGGDEFAILSTAADQREAVTALADRLLDAVAEPCNVDGHEIDIDTSIGIALAPEHGTEVDQLVKMADLALYKAKADGRKRYRFFEDAMATEAGVRHVLQTDLRNALANDELELHYQTIIDIGTGEVASVEALIRWRHPLRGMISPAEFIPLAEETGLIHPIGEWVLRTACRDAIGWPSQIKVSVNLSPVEFRKAGLIEQVCAVVTGSGLPPTRLEVEITESVLLHGDAENIQALHRLRQMGVSVVLDDFGTGYSSLSYLRMFAFNKIKIDRSFVHELAKNRHCASIVSAVAYLGKSLQIATVAEGIETEDQLLLVRAAGCTHAQGYLIGRPCPAKQLTFAKFRPRDSAAA